MELQTFDQHNVHDYPDLNSILSTIIRTMDDSTKTKESNEGSFPACSAHSLISQLTHSLAAAIYEINKLEERVAHLESTK